MDEQFLKSVGGGICKKHGQYYGICHCCLSEQRKQDDKKFIDELESQIQEYRSLLWGIEKERDSLADALSYIYESTNEPRTAAKAKEALASLQADKERSDGNSVSGLS